MIMQMTKGCRNLAELSIDKASLDSESTSDQISSLEARGVKPCYNIEGQWGRLDICDSSLTYGGTLSDFQKAADIII
jgi:hypothetical protein